MELKRVQIKTDNFYKLSSKALKKSYLKRTAKNMEDSFNSDSNYALKKIYAGLKIYLKPRSPKSIPILLNVFGNIPKLVNSKSMS